MAESDEGGMLGTLMAVHDHGHEPLSSMFPVPALWRGSSVTVWLVRSYVGCLMCLESVYSDRRLCVSVLVHNNSFPRDLLPSVPTPDSSSPTALAWHRLAASPDRRLHCSPCDSLSGQVQSLRYKVLGVQTECASSREVRGAERSSSGRGSRVDVCPSHLQPLGCGLYLPGGSSYLRIQVAPEGTC